MHAGILFKYILFKYFALISGRISVCIIVYLFTSLQNTEECLVVSLLNCNALHCNTLDITATHTATHTATYICRYSFVKNRYSSVDIITQLYACVFGGVFRRALTSAQLCALRRTAPHYNTLQHPATHCSKVQHNATQCNTLQNTLKHTLYCATMQCNTHCNILQHTAAHCNTLQHTAAHCSTLQHTLQYTETHTATHCTAKYCNTLQNSARQRSCTHLTTLHHSAPHSITR